MAKPTYHYLKISTGITSVTYCTKEENQEYAQLLAENKPLPVDIIQGIGSDSKPFFAHVQTDVPPDKEQNYILMRIFNDLHFIRILFQVLLILAIISVFVILVRNSLMLM